MRMLGFPVQSFMALPDDLNILLSKAKSELVLVISSKDPAEVSELI